MFTLIPQAHAAATDAQFAAQCFVDKINDAILFPLITLLMALAFLFFLYGAFEYVKNSGSDAGRETGRRHLLYGVIGMLVMLSAFSILNIAAGTFGLAMFDSDTIVCGSGPVSSTEATGPAAGGAFGEGAFSGAGADTLPAITGDSPVIIGFPPTQPDAPGIDSIDGVIPDVGAGSGSCPRSQPVMLSNGICTGSPAVDISGGVPEWDQEYLNKYVSYGLSQTDSTSAEKAEILNDPEWEGATQVLFTLPIVGSESILGPSEVLCEDATGITGNIMNIDSDRGVYVCFNY